MNRWTVQTYLTELGHWDDVYSYPTITEAVSSYKHAISEYPDLAFRIIQVLEVEE